jgi:hypothetical protein
MPYSLFIALVVAIVGGCASKVEVPDASQPIAVPAKPVAVPTKPLASVTDDEWDECRQQAAETIRDPEPGPGLGDTGERAAYTYGGAIGAIISLMSAKSRAPATHSEDELEERYRIYWKAMKYCLRNKGYIVADDKIEVERP